MYNDVVSHFGSKVQDVSVRWSFLCERPCGLRCYAWVHFSQVKSEVIILIFIFLIISNVEHLLIYPLAMYMSSLEKCLLRSSTHFSVGLLAFSLLSCMSCLYILEVKPLSVTSFAKISYHTVHCLFLFVF